MLHKIIQHLDSKVSFTQASAHCDIPCKIYDPSGAQIAALTVIRMMDLIDELSQKESLSIKDQVQLNRLVAEKEAHGTKVKEEIRVIWGDYFKQPQFDQFPDIHALVHNIMLTASKAKQGVSRADGEELLSLVNQFAAAFWTTKGVDTFQATCPYPPAETVVYPKLAEI
jgi:nickel superoxide dismutase